MSKITVYSFRTYDVQQDALLLARGKATREKIGKLGGFIIESSAEDIESSLLNETERYHQEQLKK